MQIERPSIEYRVRRSSVRKEYKMTNWCPELFEFAASWMNSMVLSEGPIGAVFVYAHKFSYVAGFSLYLTDPICCIEEETSQTGMRFLPLRLVTWERQCRFLLNLTCRKNVGSFLWKKEAWLLFAHFVSCPVRVERTKTGVLGVWACEYQ